MESESSFGKSFGNGFRKGLGKAAQTVISIILFLILVIVILQFMPQDGKSEFGQWLQKPITELKIWQLAALVWFASILSK